MENDNIENINPLPKNPLVFISHDTKDAELAEIFSKLLSSVSAGVLKSFRSSDKKGSQGMEYGVEWYPEIMKKLDDATDVVCLLTKNSIERPWILYEAGVAKGKLNKTLFGVAIGIPLGKASNGPFAQFQNCADDEDSLSKLVMQLVKRIPNSEPDKDVVRYQVSNFLEKAKELIQKSNIEVKQKEKVEAIQDSAVTKLFEEIKVMYTELPLKINRKINSEGRINRTYRLNPSLINELLYSSRNRSSALLLVLSLIRDQYPWLYAVGNDLIKATRNRNSFILKKTLADFKELLMYTIENPILREIYPMNEIDSRYYREYCLIIKEFLERTYPENDIELDEGYNVINRDKNQI